MGAVLLIIDEIGQLLDSYVHWLREKTHFREIDGWVEITTPYLDRHNDYIQIYAKKTPNGYILSDDGYTIIDLIQAGCKLDSPRRRELLKLTLNGFGIELNEDRLEVTTSCDSFSLTKHNLVQAILAVNDMFYMATPVVASLFYEHVVSWLEIHEIRYSPGVKFTGKSGYDHRFDFLIPKSSARPERIVQAISNPNRTTTQALSFAWFDIREDRPPNSTAYAVLNDTNRSVSGPVLEALKQYQVKPVLWSSRDEFRHELSA